MKKITSKFIKLFAIVLISIIGLNNLITNVNAAPSTITLGNAEAIPKLIGQTYFSIMKTTSGEYVYCLDINKTTVTNQTLKLVGEKDAGFAYLMQNGYPAKNITGDRISDIYITQTAVWWYLDSTTGSANLSNYFKTSAPDSRGLRGYISNLVNGAIAARNQGYATTSISINNSNSTMSLSSDKKYYVSNPIGVTSSNISSYDVALNNAPSGTIITTEAGQQTTSFSPSAKFLVKVPADKVTSTSMSLTVNVSATGTVYKAYEYQPSDPSRYQNVMASVLSPVSTKVTASTTVNIKTSKVTIIKLDKKTGKPLTGAKLVLKDSSGKVITSWTSTTNAHVIKNLSNGTYKIEEKEAPKGYKKLEKPVTFKIDDNNREQVVKVSNELTPGVVKVLKIDKATNKALAGAKFVLKDSTGKIIDSWTSTTTAHTINNLENGKYKIEEIEAPKGYKKLEKAITFTIDDSNKSLSFKVSNEAKETVVTITKIDASTKEILPGAVLVIKDKSGKEIARFTTTKEAYVLTNIKYGTYTVEEISAPAGYKLSTEKKTFTIDDEHLSHQISFENYPEVRVPDTNSKASGIMHVLGITIIGIAAGFVYKNGKAK